MEAVVATVLVVPPFPCATPLPATITPLLLSSSRSPAVLPPRDFGTVVPPVFDPLGPYATEGAP